MLLNLKPLNQKLQTGTNDGTIVCVKVPYLYLSMPSTMRHNAAIRVAIF